MEIDRERSLQSWGTSHPFPAQVFLQRAFVLKGRRHFPERVFGPLVAALSVATNAVCGAFYFDDLGLLGSHITPVLSPDVPMEAPPPASNSDVAFYFAGVGLAVAGTLLTLPLEPAGDEKAEAAAGADADEFGDGSPYDPEYDQHVFGDAYGALTKAPLGDDPLLGPGRKPKEQKRDWNCGASARTGSRDPPPPTGGGSAWEAAAAEAMNNGATFAASLDADL